MGTKCLERNTSTSERKSARCLLCGEGLAGVGPSERLCHSLVEELDEGLEPGFEILLGGEVAAPDDLSGQDREPDLDLIEPGGMLGREVKRDAVAGIA